MAMSWDCTCRPGEREGRKGGVEGGMRPVEASHKGFKRPADVPCRHTDPIRPGNGSVMHNCAAKTTTVPADP